MFLQPSLVPPYCILVDTNFINFSIQNKLDLEKGMMDCLYAKSQSFIVATRDRDMKRRIRRVPGVPIMYITQHKYSIERLPEATIGGVAVILEFYFDEESACPILCSLTRKRRLLSPWCDYYLAEVSSVLAKNGTIIVCAVSQRQVGLSVAPRTNPCDS
ncbi:hypothetical protein V6N11_015784 [Hibiscus sabdariffa]|uniref:PIN domain-containing protein n=1 Tax=Hibiscus sabdariffa TaxID=183260 RepID=A0ABR2TTG8_9ROSI